MLLRFSHPFKKSSVWLVPEHIVGAEELEKIPDEIKDTPNAKKIKYTMVHMMGKTAKFFVKESPGEINTILEKYAPQSLPLKIIVENTVRAMEAPEHGKGVSS